MFGDSKGANWLPRKALCACSKNYRYKNLDRGRDVKGCVAGRGKMAQSLKDRVLGSLLGLAVGDALGTTVEFMPPGSFEEVTGMQGGGKFSLQPGQVG